MTENFQVLPAIDLINGRCVRLYKGSYDQKTEYNISPREQAKFFEQEGADVLHVVDLDGARKGNTSNLRTISKIREAINIPMEVGGGIRDMESAEKLFEVGIDRIIIGTAAVENPDFLAELLNKYGAEKIVVGVDARKSGSTIATHGWKGETNLNTIEFAEKLADTGVKRIIFTDIARDGTLTFPNFDMSEKLVNLTKLKVIVAGGVTQISHFQTLRKVGCEGAIIGKALYESDITVSEIKSSLNN